MAEQAWAMRCRGRTWVGRVRVEEARDTCSAEPLWLSKAGQMSEDGVLWYDSCARVFMAPKLCTNSCVKGGKKWGQ